MKYSYISYILPFKFRYFPVFLYRSLFSKGSQCSLKIATTIEPSETNSNLRKCLKAIVMYDT